MMARTHMERRTSRVPGIRPSQGRTFDSDPRPPRPGTSGPPRNAPSGPAKFTGDLSRRSSIADVVGSFLVTQGSRGVKAIHPVPQDGPRSAACAPCPTERLAVRGDRAHRAPTRHSDAISLAQIFHEAFANNLHPMRNHQYPMSKRTRVAYRGVDVCSTRLQASRVICHWDLVIPAVLADLVRE
jgi:hypothetical protein